MKSGLLLLALCAGSICLLTDASLANAQTPTGFDSTQPPWIDLHLSGQALNDARAKAHVNLLVQRNDHSFFLMTKERDGGHMLFSVGSSVALVGPAEIQLGNLKQTKTYSAGAGELAVCMADPDILRCEIGRRPPPAPMVRPGNGTIGGALTGPQ